MFDGLTWKGLKDDERVAQIDLGASGLNIDFTSPTATSQQMRAGAIALRDQMRRINSQYAEQTWYVSGEIISNWERFFSDNYQSGTVMDEILKLTGVAAIKEDSQLSGNEIVIVPLGAGVIAPIVGQAVGAKDKRKEAMNAVQRIIEYVQENPISHPCVGHIENIGGIPPPQLTEEGRIVFRLSFACLYGE